MKKFISFLTRLCSPRVDSQSSDVSLDRRLTVGSPSILHRLTKYIAVMFLLLVVGVGNAWGTDYTDREFAFTSSTVPTGWETNGDFNTSYYKFDAGEYAQTTSVTAFIPSGEVLSTDMDVKVACGRFGTWSSTKTLRATVQLLDGSGNVLSSSYADFSSLSAGIPYKSAITVSKPEHPENIARLKIILSNFVSTTSGCARFGGVKLTYKTATAGTSVTLSKTSPINGSFTLTQSSTPVTEVTTTSSAQTVDITCTPATGYQTSSVSATNPATLPSAITYGGSADSRTVTYPTGANGTSKITVNFTAISRTVSYSGDTHISSYTTKPTSATIEDEDLTVEYTVESGYAITGVSATIGGAAVDASDMEWDQSSLYILPTDGITGNVAITFTIEELSGYCISAFNSSNNGITSGFSNGGSGNEYTLNYTIPGKDGSNNWPQYWIGENEAYQSFSASANFADMHVTTCDATIGLAEGATGRLHIWDNNKADGSNLWVKFEPSGYGLRWGGADWSQAANTKAFTVDAGDANVYWTDIVTLDGTNNTTWNYYVGLQTASGYVYSGVDNEASDSRGISRTRSVTAMKVSNGTAGSWKGTYLSSEPTGSRGKFRIWNNNIDDYNFYCHWVPFYRVTYDGSGASGSTAASADVCCEGNAAARTVVAAANGFTVPTGKSFGGWASSPENAAAGVVAYAAGANVVLTSSITLYAIWTDINYTVTVNQNPSVGATTTGQTTTAHYNGTINLRTTVPSGYRFVNWTTSDGFSITNPTSATTASFTMPAKNVTVTANFQQTHTIDWYVGGSAPGNKLVSGSQTVLVDHGGSITTLPSEPSGSACDKEFMGWTNTSSYIHGESPLYSHNTASFPAINVDASFYAVFAAGGNTEYVLTPAASLTAGEYVIAAYDDANSKYLALTGAVSAASLGSNSDMVNETTGFTISEGKFTTLPTGACEFVLTAYTGETDNGFYIQNPADNKYLDYQTTTNRRLWFYAATDYVDEYDNPTTPWAAWYGVALSKDGFPDNGMYLKYVDETYSLMSNGSGTTFVRGYANDNTKYKPIYLFKKTGGATGHTINCADCGSSVTPTYTAAPTGGTVSVTKSASPVASGSTVKTCTAVDLTVTISPATHYTLTGFTATGLTTGTATISPAVNTVVPTTSAQTFTVTVSAGATGTLNLTPTFTAQTPLTITLSTNSKGTFTTPTEFPIYAGETFTFPDVTPSDPTCATFVGWIAGTSFSGDGSTHDAPVTIAAGSTSDAQNANATYTAVFYETETTETDAYVKVTETPASWANDHYLIVYEGDATHAAVAFDGKRDNGDNGNIDAVSNGVEVTITNDAIAKTARLAAAEWRIAAVTGGHSIQSASGFYIGQTTDANGLQTNSSTAYVNTLAYSSGFSVTGSGNAVLRYNYASDQLRFRYYKSSSYSSQQVIQLYKLGTAEVQTRTYTTNPSCTPKYRVTVASVTGGSPNADPRYNPESTEVSLTANPSAGYSFTGWTITHTEGGAAASVTYTSGSASTATAVFEMPEYDVTVTAAYSKIYVTSVVAKEGETVLNTSDHKLIINTGANKTVTVVVTPADAFDHSWSAEVTAGDSYASISNVTSEGFRVNGLAQGDATIVVTAPNDDGTDKTATFTVHVTDILPEAIILKRDGSSAEIETLTMYYDAANTKGQYVKVNVSYTPTPTNKDFTFTTANDTYVSSHAQGHTNPNYYVTLNAKKVTTSPINCTFTSSADGSVTKVLAVTVLPILTDQFVDYIHGNATQSVSARLSADRYDIITDINTPSLTDASDANPTSEDCETAHYHLIGWLPQATAEALWEAGTPITEATEGLVRAGVQVEATGQTWYAIWAKEQ